jgi:hypothetical protein
MIDKADLDWGLAQIRDVLEDTSALAEATPELAEAAATTSP